MRKIIKQFLINHLYILQKKKNVHTKVNNINGIKFAI